ncbi:hypothetical protein PF011_g18988 [Phytophthora fragariae]|uniref:Uncharacterized protein n=1 Tax=Phytophthora fragariae TaxID=53985 RepID=A0A6A3J970_9STRA|nr:hypothetical protein PF011_g18988 [Phytophthora fragariae]
MLHVVAGLIATLLASMQPATSSTTTECWGTEKQTSGYIDLPNRLSNLLNIGLRVLLYAGDADILCNIYATEATAKKLKWSGAPGFNAVQERPYLTSSGITDAGSVQSYSHLTFVKVHEAGHMVPGDQPKLALDMITKFIHNQTF